MLTFPKNGFVTIRIVLGNDESVNNIAESCKRDASLRRGPRSRAKIKGSTASTSANDGIEPIIAITNDLASGLQRGVHGRDGAPRTQIGAGLRERRAEGAAICPEAGEKAEYGAEDGAVQHAGRRG